MRKALIVKLWRIERLVCMKVVHQDAYILRGDFDFRAQNGLHIISKDEPKISRTGSIYIRGTDYKQDEHLTFVECDNAEEAQGLVARIREAVSDLNCRIPSEDYEGIETCYEE